MSFIGGYQSDFNLNSIPYVGNFPIEHSLGGFGIASGVNDYTLSLSPPITQYRLGMPLAVKFQNNNTGTATIKVDTEGVVSIKKIVAGNLVDATANDLDSDKIYLLIYDGTYFQIANLSEAGSSSVEKFSLSNKFMNALVTLKDGDLGCTTAILDSPIPNSGVMTLVNGVEKIVRRPTDTGKTYNTAGGAPSGTQIISNTCRTLFFDAANRLLYVGANGGFWIYNLTTQTGSSVLAGTGAGNGQQLPNTAQAIYKDLTHQILWIGTFNGLWKYNMATDTGKIYTISSGAASGQQLPGNDIQSVYVDEVRNILYAGTAAGGLWEYNIATDTGKVYNPLGGAANGQQIPSYFIASLYKDTTTNILYVGALGGVWQYNSNTSTGKVYSTAGGAGSGQQLPNNNVRQILKEEGNNILYAATDGGIWEYLIATDVGKRFTTASGALTGEQLPANDVRSVFKDAVNNILYASTNSNGAWQINLNTFHGKRYTVAGGATNGNQLPGSICRTIIKILPENLFYVATFGGGLWEYKYNVGIKVNGFFSPNGTLIREYGTEQAGDKLYWIGSNGSQLQSTDVISFNYLK